MRAPFPWPGGKGRVAHVVWQGLGDPRTYVEPFAGSLAALLGRPKSAHARPVEIVSDLDGHVANFWRAFSRCPDLVREYADWPAIESELRERVEMLHASRAVIARSLEHDDEHFYAATAGWWAWAQTLCIAELRGFRYADGAPQRIERQQQVLREIAGRVCGLTVMCGDWRRTCESAALARPGGAYFLDPPYGVGDLRYGAAVRPVAPVGRPKPTQLDILWGDPSHVLRDALAWALDAGARGVRVCLASPASYAGDFGPGWQLYRWRRAGGAVFGGRGEDADRDELLAFSPACDPVSGAEIVGA